jgi:hypothetical protein
MIHIYARVKINRLNRLGSLSFQLKLRLEMIGTMEDCLGNVVLGEEVFIAAIELLVGCDVRRWSTCCYTTESITIRCSGRTRVRYACKMEHR